jgi:hypothetical protein
MTCLLEEMQTTAVDEGYVGIKKLQYLSNWIIISILKLKYIQYPRLSLAPLSLSLSLYLSPSLSLSVHLTLSPLSPSLSLSLFLYLSFSIFLSLSHAVYLRRVLRGAGPENIKIILEGKTTCRLYRKPPKENKILRWILSPAAGHTFFRTGSLMLFFEGNM